ncbi:MAG: heavy-metal-associated domain-containing protein [Clostridiales bacterium]|nr:heavy-metal-associated domain-containing protein [Clostridiales bacterium]
MKKTFKMEDLGCAHCAAKMEDAIKKLDGVANANVNFLAQKVTIEAADDRFEAIVKEAAKVCKKIEPDCRIIVK